MANLNTPSNAAYPRFSGLTPLVLTIPGLGGSERHHWQSIWERQRDETTRVDLGEWHDPRRNNWVNRLNLAIHRADRPVILAAHSLGCLAVAWWVEYEAQQEPHNVVGALLVAPPDVERDSIDPRLARFAPPPQTAMPFPSLVVASRNDPHIGFHRAKQLAKTWGSRFADAGAIGHINAESFIGDWAFGQLLLRQLIGGRVARAATPPPSAEQHHRRPPGLVAA